MGTERATTFWADGPESRGFFTYGPRIRVGGEFNGTDMGVQCRGPSGIQATGEDFGVMGIGREPRDGVGRAGRGGWFMSAKRRAQVHLMPDALLETPGNTQPATPHELAGDGVGAQLPYEGMAGDLYMTAVPRLHGVLWLCVRPSGGGSGAEWRQVLLGEAVMGEQPL